MPSLPLEVILSLSFWLDPQPDRPSFYLGVLLGAAIAAAGFCFLLRTYAHRRLERRPVARRLALDVGFWGLLLGGGVTFFVLARIVGIPYLSMRLFPGLLLALTGAQLIHLGYYWSRYYRKERAEYERTLKERQRRQRQAKDTRDATVPSDPLTDSPRGEE